MKKALITGVTGQDGSYLAEFLLAKGYEVQLFLGNIDALRDWGHARDYVEMQWLMLQQQEPEDFVAVDPRYFRPTEVETLLGDAGKARQRLGWTPQTSFESMVREMVAHDLDSARRHRLIESHGYHVAISLE
jgi:GDPmannose 4,6-dehydratase